MKNFVQHGDNLTISSLTAAATAGVPYKQGALIGIPTNNGAIGERCVVETVGVFELVKLTAQAWAFGDAIYWDDAAKNCTTVVGANTKIGVAADAAVNPSTVGLVRLNGSF
jgi:predicted RecA/RadA family phage recombinase